jgi:hypothetical protein
VQTLIHFYALNFSQKFPCCRHMYTRLSFFVPEEVGHHLESFPSLAAFSAVCSEGDGCCGVESAIRSYKWLHLLNDVGYDKYLYAEGKPVRVRFWLP